MTIKRYNSNTSTWVQVGVPSSAIANSTVTAKGDIIVGTASATVANQSVGGNYQTLIADSSVTNGLRWGDDLQILTLMGASI